AVLFADLACLGNRVEPDIRLVGIPPGVVLVILLGGKERLEWFERRNDRTRKGFGGGQFLDRRLGGPLLIVVRVEHRRAILRSHVGPLAVQLGRVVSVEENVEEPLIADPPWIVSDADGLGVPGIAVADATVMGRFGRAAGVAALHVTYAVKLFE